MVSNVMMTDGYWIETDLKVKGTGITEVSPRIYLEALRKTAKSSVKIIGIQAEIRNKHLRNTSLEPYCYTKFRSQ